MRITIKIGSNVLTRSDGSLDVTRMSALVDQIATLRTQGFEIILVSSGAVASGRSELKHINHDLDSVDQRQLFSAVGQAKLINRYFELFREYGIAVGQVLTTKENFADNEHRKNQENCMRVMLENGVLPIVNENDTVSVTELMFTDNDELSGLIARMTCSQMLIILSNIDGIYTGNPSDPASQLISIVKPGKDLSDYIQQSKSSAGRGGMQSKSSVASATAAVGISVIIANGKRDNILVRLMNDRERTLCTEFLPTTPSVINNTTSEDKEQLSMLTGSPLSCNMKGLCQGDSQEETLLSIASALTAHTPEILEANKRDLAKMSEDNPLYDRLKLTPERMQGIINDMRNVAMLPSPLGKVLKQTTLDNGLKITKVSVSFGTIGVVYEARPNVTIDVFALCFKAGSKCVLKGGKDADETNRKIVEIIKTALGEKQDAITLLPATHEATAQLLHANGKVDLVIPRGSKRLIDFVRNEATVPVIETGAGVCHAYYDKDADLSKGTRIVCNAKTRRVSVCNALDCLLIHADRVDDLPAICQPLSQSNVVIYADKSAFTALAPFYPTELLRPATDESYGTEFLSYTMAIKCVSSADEAISHILANGSGHSECIITENTLTANQFIKQVDAACVYHNAPTSFTDGAQFGLGAEIGISTQKLHARGPMALEEICTYKWVVEGNGQIRK